MNQELLDLFEKTRQGKNPCPICEKPMEMYGSPWCPVCDKPELEGRELNLIQALRHIEAIGNPGYYDRLWHRLVDDYLFGNDSGFLLCFPEKEELEEQDSQYWEDLQLVKNTWDLTDCVLMWVSW